MPVTTRIIPFLVGNPYKPLFETVTGWGVDQNNTVFVYGFLDFWSFLISHIFYFYFCWPEISASQAMIIRFLFGVSIQQVSVAWVDFFQASHRPCNRKSASPAYNCCIIYFEYQKIRLQKENEDHPFSCFLGVWTFFWPRSNEKLHRQNEKWRKNLLTCFASEHTGWLIGILGLAYYNHHATR